MKKKIALFLFFVCFLSGQFLSAQTYPTGAIIDPVIYDSVPQKAVQLSRTYTSTSTSIPAAYSLKQYTPTPNQQRGSTCVGWATAYAARTIAESIALNRADRFLTTQNVFSPFFVYKSVHFYKYNNPNPTGDEGLVTAWAMDFLKTEGAIKMPNNELFLLIHQFMLSAYSRNKRYPIADYVTLVGDNNSTRTQMVKKSISENKPVVIAIYNYPASFYSAKEVWNPSATDEIGNVGHALCVVGYDDNRYGGAFEIQNSWGTDWGNGGYTWIPYAVFNKYAAEAYEMIENLSNYKDAVEFSGSVQIELFNSRQGMPVRFADGYYQTVNGYASGTEFRYLLGNGKPAYVYAFAADSGSNITTRIFPPEGKNISPVLDYSENIVALPGEYSWIKLDQRAGTDYLVVLYAKEALDIDTIRRRFAEASGSFPERAARAVGSNYIPADRAKYESGEIRFSASSPNPKAVFGLLLAIDHR
jgi:C1A family cysteine protease